MIYDRYAGMVSLPGADGKMPRPFRVDEDGNVIYRDEYLDAVRSLGEDRPIQLAEAPNPNWNGYETMRAQGQRDGQILRDYQDRFFRSKDNDAPLLPPATRTYPVPRGYKAWALDPQHRFILDANDKPVRHPDYKRAFDGDVVDEKGVAYDLGKIALGVAVPLRAGAMTATGAGMMVASSATKEGYEQAKERRPKKGAR